MQLSPPLEGMSAVGATTAASSADGAERLIETSVAAGAPGGSASPVGQPTVRQRPATGDLASPLPGTSGVASPPLTGRPSEGAEVGTRSPVSGESPVLLSGERGGGPAEHRSSGGGLGGVVHRSGGSSSEAGGEAGVGVARRESRAGATSGAGGAARAGGPGG